MAEYKTIKTPGEGEIIEKKSRFLASAVHVETEEEAASYLESVKKKYYDARHSCWAYVLGENGGNLRASDDGEPQGTAGKPMLDVLTGAGLTNTMVVVTRYFGGTLLGTGGLVRAYSASADAAIKNAEIKTMKVADTVMVNVSYTDVGKIQYLFGQNNIKVADSSYGADVTFTIVVETERTDRIIKLIVEATAGKAVIENVGTDYYEF